MKFWNRLWSEEFGAVLSAEIALLSSVLVIGAVTGLTAVRDSVDKELGDVADAFSRVNQSYGYTGLRGCGAFTAGSFFYDRGHDNCVVVYNECPRDEKHDRVSRPDDRPKGPTKCCACPQVDPPVNKKTN